MPIIQQKYGDLARDGSSIRMLVILPSRRSKSMLRCKLIQVNLDDLDAAPFAFYEALSYTWGDMSGLVKCKLNGLDHHITKNLDAALRRLRGRTRKRYIWVDALCINQDDLAERGHQVLLMRRIYSQADQVLVWLGVETDDVKIAIEMLDAVVALEGFDDAQLQESLASLADLEKWKAVARFFSRPWFRRLWVRQEVALAKQITVICGRWLLRWDEMNFACELLDDNAVLFDEIVTQVSNRGSGQQTTFFMEAFRQKILKGLHPDLEQLLLHARGADVTDPRDRVYGMLGLAGDQGEGIDVDYTLTNEEVFRNAMITVLNNRGNLNPLSGCQLSASRNEGIPSWVIDLSQDWREMILRLRGDGQDLYCAAGDSNASFHFSKDKSKLVVEGYVLDVISEVGLPLVAADGIEPTLLEWSELMHRCTSRQADQNWPNGGGLAGFMRTLIADQGIEGERASASFLSSYVSFTEIAPFITALENRYQSEPEHYELRVHEVCGERRAFGTKAKGYFGLGGAKVSTDDLVVIFFSAGVPFILHPEGDGTYTLVGEAYVDGVMDGEAYRDLQSGGSATVTFTIR